MLNSLFLFLGAMTLGTLCIRLHLPIPYLIGGMVTCLLWKSLLPQREAAWPKPWREVALTIAGYGIGGNFSTHALDNMMNQVLGVIEANVSILAASFAIAYVTYRMTREDFKSCVFGMLPGGMTLAMLMAEEDENCNPNVIMVMQVLRLFSVLFAVPFMVIYLLGAQMVTDGVSAPYREGIHWLVFIPIAIVGCYVAKKIHLPTQRLLGPILATAVFTVCVGPVQPVPFYVMAPAQASIGIYMGMQLDFERIKRTSSLLPYILIGCVILLSISVGMAYELSHRYGFSLVTAFLAMAPGGITEMSLAGLSMGEDVSIILTYQLVRVFSINIFVPPFVAWYFKDKQVQNT